MARARNIKPAFFTNEDIVELPYETRLLFIGLWTLADREGRLEDRPRRIKIELFPADNIDIDECLNQLQSHGFILRYTVENARYIQVIAFTKHQRPHHKEAASTIPEPPKGKAGGSQARTKVGVSTNLGECSPPLIPDTGYLNADTGEGGASAPDPTPGKPKSTRGTRLPDDFVVTPEMMAWAREKGATDRLIQFETEKFRDYWPAQPGQRGVKVNWVSTWRNWIRRAIDDAPAGTLRRVDGSSQYVGFDPHATMPKDEHDEYLRKLEEAKAKAAALEREQMRGVG